MNWQLPSDIKVEELVYLQQNVYPKLKESFVYLVQYLMESGEHLDQYRSQRRDEYEELLKEKEEIIKKCLLEQGSDYNESSDEETKKVDQKIKNFENFHKQDMEQIKTERSGIESERRSTSRSDILNDHVKQQQKRYEEDLVIEADKNTHFNGDGQQEGDTGRAKYKFKKIDRFSECSSDNDTDPDEYIRRDSYQRNKSFHVFNPLTFLAEELKRRNQNIQRN